MDKKLLGWLLVLVAILILAWKFVSWVFNLNLVVVILLLIAGILLIKSRKRKR